MQPLNNLPIALLYLYGTAPLNNTSQEFSNPYPKNHMLESWMVE